MAAAWLAEQGARADVPQRPPVKPLPGARAWAILPALPMAPERRYSRDHTWAERRDGALLVGLTAYAIDRLGLLRDLQIAVVCGDVVTPGQTIGSAESDRAVVALFTPVGGRVLEINPDIDAAQLHEDCYVAGWLLKLEPGESEFSGLLDAAAYHEFLRMRSADL
jgi:glycine cleavage system H protein